MTETHEQQPDVSDRLIAALASEGTYEGTGSFDIDVRRGLDRLERFQLADPHGYALRLIEAGLIAGADQLRVGMRLDGLTLEWVRAEPIVIPPGTLARVLMVLVGSGKETSELPRAVLVQLAVGMLAALGLGGTIVIESVDAGGTGSEVRYISAAEQARRPLYGAAPGTRITVMGIPEHTRVYDMIVLHCAAVAIPVVVDHRRINGLLRQDAIVTTPVLREDVVVGEAMFTTSSTRPAELLLLERGLVIERRVLDGLRPGFVARVDAPLRRDLSQAAFAEPDEIAALEEAARVAHSELWSPYVVQAQTAARQQATEVKSEFDARFGALLLGLVGIFETARSGNWVVLWTCLALAVLYWVVAAALRRRR